MAYAILDEMKSLTLDDLESHRKPVRLAILATAGFLYNLHRSHAMRQSVVMRQIINDKSLFAMIIAVKEH